MATSTPCIAWMSWSPRVYAPAPYTPCCRPMRHSSGSLATNSMYHWNAVFAGLSSMPRHLSPAVTFALPAPCTAFRVCA